MSQIVNHLIVTLAALSTGVALAKPSAVTGFCQQASTSPHCSTGQVACTFCHTAAPALNSYGNCLKPEIVKNMGAGGFDGALALALRAVDGMDCDGDGISNAAEIAAGTLPSDGNSRPGGTAKKAETLSCEEKREATGYDLCGYDGWFAFRRVMQEVCGRSPSFDEKKSFVALAKEGQKQKVADQLDVCMQTDYWRGKDGVLWRMAHVKIEPLQTLKSGENRGEIPLGDYDDDYALFVYHQIDGHDARGVLTADYFVVREGDPSTYRMVDEVPVHPNAGGVVKLGASIFKGRQQFVPKEMRAGMLTTMWFAVTRTMFTSIPRATAAAAMRRFLNVDLAKSQGLIAPQDPNFRLVDYDAKGVTNPACAFCHNALDPLAYPFTKYNGLSFNTPGNKPVDIGAIFSDEGADFGIPKFIPPALVEAFVMNSNTILVPGMYKEKRIPILSTKNQLTEPGLGQTPEAGFFMGKPVANLRDWARAAADSKEFAQATVLDYWHLMVGGEPTDKTKEEFAALATSFSEADGYNVEAMLHKLVMTEAFGAP